MRQGSTEPRTRDRSRRPSLARLGGIPAVVMSIVALSSCSSECAVGVDPGCRPGATPATPPGVESIVVSGPDSLLAAGNVLQLTAVAHDAAGDAVGGVTVVWSSSDESIAMVDDDGTVTGLTAGAVMITARGDDRSGRMEVRVLAADLKTIEDLAADPYVLSLAQLIDEHLGAGLLQLFAQLKTAAATGTISPLRDAHDAVLAAIDNPAGGDAALLVIIGLVINHTERLLNY